jgi:hypothetical protein
MPFDCDHRRTHGPDVCPGACHAVARGAFAFVRADRAGDLPPSQPGTVDVFVLDMNHGWPNIGHDAIVMAVRTAVCDLTDLLAGAGLRVRVVSCDVRRGFVVPPLPDGRGGLYLGTGGPGHVDPAHNDGGDGSQGIVESVAWESPLFALFDAVHAHPDAALIGICHTFGVMNRWLGVADPVRRGPEKGGKSVGIVDTVLTAETATHPWFGALAQTVADEPGHAGRIRVLDSRLYDLLPRPSLAGTVTPLAYELAPGGGAGQAVTMWEAARDRTGTMPRVFGVNHHPEIVNRARALRILWNKRSRGEVSHEWYRERADAMAETLRDDAADRGLDVTSRYTLFGPLRYHLERQIALRRVAPSAGRASS